MSASTQVPHFTAFEHNEYLAQLPKQFTFPFYYQPHPLAKRAAQVLQQHLSNQQPVSTNEQGRMYGVLVVKNAQQQLGFISAVSGTELAKNANNTNNLLVPPVFTGFEPSHEFFEKQRLVNQINDEISQLQTSLVYQQQKQLLVSEQSAAQFQISQAQAVMANNRQLRKQVRQKLAPLLEPINEQDSPFQFAQATKQSIELARQSVADKKQLAQLKAYWQQRINQAEQCLSKYEHAIKQLKKSRQKISHRLQKQLFRQYRLLNAKGEVKNVMDIFHEFAQITPPAGAGDCAAPKLLHYAYTHQLIPICMAEFWWGQPAQSEVRKHLHYYPACQGKCQAILNHMLTGLEVEENPLLINPAQDKQLEIIYQDQHLVVVNKPAGMLSVPGKHIKDSAYTRIKSMCPNAQGSLVLHRLDMATSGLLLFSLNERAHKHLQQQFINKDIRKRYIAVIEGQLSQPTGVIALPLITDINDRPRQKVCYQHGKPAETRWQVLSSTENTTRVQLNPVTGRTHQLRVHCAHPHGLNSAIVGDGLYGKSADRLHLHAEQLSFMHPVTKKLMSFQVAAEF
ncbi:RluA family pseudouridine synthase [Thalassotalea sp. G2M2-11]|uniref:RluA family pseudouridine synthase n=1 Tax=Thalassotalea sp. G2M2-11 TaxID=2787627 RepID=UPI0019CFA10A|nr:RluA family pseudouridine synthase [Thalassotalea sp. G2M2-11]